MPSIEETTIIKAPIETVFAEITDPKRTAEWNSNVIEVTNISSYPIHAGTTWHQVAMIAGRRANLQCRVLRFEPPFAGELEISGDHQGRTWTYCRQIGEGTEVIQGIEFHVPGGILGRAALKLMQPALTGELRKTMDRQRNALERKGRI